MFPHFYQFRSFYVKYLYIRYHTQFSIENFYLVWNTNFNMININRVSNKRKIFSYLMIIRSSVDYYDLHSSSVSIPTVLTFAISIWLIIRGFFLLNKTFRLTTNGVEWIQQKIRITQLVFYYTQAPTKWILWNTVIAV